MAESKEPLDESGRGEWENWLKTQQSKNKDHGIQFYHSRQINEETKETVADCIFLGSKIPADDDYSHEIKRFLLLLRKSMTNLREGNGNPLQYSCLENPMDRESWSAAVHGVAKSRTGLSDFTLHLLMTNLDSLLKSRDVTLLTKVHIVKAMVFPVVMYRCERWAIKKAKHWNIDAFELWCWERVLRIPGSRKANQSILKDINPEYLLKGLMLKLKLW